MTETTRHTVAGEGRTKLSRQPGAFVAAASRCSVSCGRFGRAIGGGEEAARASASEEE